MVLMATPPPEITCRPPLLTVVLTAAPNTSSVPRTVVDVVRPPASTSRVSPAETVVPLTDLPELTVVTVTTSPPRLSEPTRFTRARPTQIYEGSIEPLDGLAVFQSRQSACSLRVGFSRLK